MLYSLGFLSDIFFFFLLLLNRSVEKKLKSTCQSEISTTSFSRSLIHSTNIRRGLLCGGRHVLSAGDTVSSLQRPLCP